MKFPKRHSANDVNIYTEIALLAEQFQAVNLSQGSPDYLPPSELTRFLKEATGQSLYQYASVCVLPMLTESIIKFNKQRLLPINLTEHELAVIPGATYGIHVALATFLEAKDEVIVLEPCYETYTPAIEIRGAIPIYFSLQGPDYTIDWDRLASVLSKKTKAIIINTPNNPTGKVWQKKDWDCLWELIKDTEIIVISDEVYDMVAFDNTNFYSANNHPEIKNRAFSVFSFEKMFHISGWKASYIIAPENYIQAFQSIHQYLSFNINVYSQYALSKYLEVYNPKIHKDIYQTKRNFFHHNLKDLPFEIHEKSEGGYFQTLGFRDFKKNISDLEFCKWLIQDKKVAAIPYSAFYHDHRNTGEIRFCFAKKEETLQKAIYNLKKN